MAKLVGWVIFLFPFLAASTAAAEEELRVLASARLTPPSVVEGFEREFGVQVRFEYFESPEALTAYLKTRPPGDLALMRGYYVEDLVRTGFLAALDHRLLPNLDNLSPLARRKSVDPGCLYAMPYLQGTVGILYRAGLWGPWPPSWENIFGPNSGPAPFALGKQYRDAMGVALLYLGYSCNSTSPIAIGQAAELLRNLTSHPAFLGFMDPDTLVRYFKERFLYVAITYNNLAAKAMAEDPGLAFHVPRQGSLGWSYVYVINDESPLKAAAHAWLNYLLRPEVAAEISAWNRATTSNRAALDFLPPEIRNNAVLYPPETVWESNEFPRSVGDAESTYLDYWSRLQ